MKMKKLNVLSLLFIAAVCFCIFLRSNGSDHIRTVQILTLIGVGMCLGVALTSLLTLFAQSKG
jgi:hypothetical protein